MKDVSPHEHSFKPFHAYQMCAFDEVVNGSELRMCCLTVTMDGKSLTPEQQQDIHDEIHTLYTGWDLPVSSCEIPDDEQEMMEIISQCSYDYRAGQREQGFKPIHPIDANLRYKIMRALKDAGWKKGDDSQ